MGNKFAYTGARCELKPVCFRSEYGCASSMVLSITPSVSGSVNNGVFHALSRSGVYTALKKCCLKTQRASSHCQPSSRHCSPSIFQTSSSVALCSALLVWNFSYCSGKCLAAAGSYCEQDKVGAEEAVVELTRPPGLQQVSGTEIKSQPKRGFP